MKLKDLLCCGNCVNKNDEEKCEYYYFGEIGHNGCDDFYGAIKPEAWQYCKKHKLDNKTMKDREYHGEKFRTLRKEK